MTQSTRVCGDCTACCDGWLSDAALGMSPGHPCPNRSDSGCSIYENRPERPCRTFFCFWLKMPEMPEALRPDRCGVIATSTFDAKERVILLSPTGPSVPDELINYFIEVVRPIGMPLVYETRVVEHGRYIGVNRIRLERPDYIHPHVVGDLTSS